MGIKHLIEVGTVGGALPFKDGVLTQGASEGAHTS